jgi:hypothetical protein
MGKAPVDRIEFNKKRLMAEFPRGNRRIQNMTDILLYLLLGVFAGI